MARTTSILTNAEVIAVGYLASLSPNLAVVTDASGYVISSSATATEVGYLSGVTSSIQTQLNDKANETLNNLSSVAINTTLLPGANDGAGLGNGSFAFSDLFLASGGVINFNNGNYTLTHSAGVLTTSGKLAIGENDTMTINGSATNTLFAVHVDDGATTENAEFHRHSNNAVGAVIYGAKSRGTGASPAIVNNGDTLLGIYAVGYDGTDYATSGALSFVVDGTPGSNDMPGALHVSLSPDGSQTLTTRLILTNAGAMTLGSVAGAGTGALFAGAISGTTGAFSGAVGMTALTATTGTFSGSVTVTGSVSATGTSNQFLVNMYGDSLINAPGMFASRAGGTSSSPTKVLATMPLYGMYARGYQETTSGFGNNTTAIRFMASEDFTSTAQGTYIDFATTSVGANSRAVRMLLNESGLTLGTTSGVGTGTVFGGRFTEGGTYNYYDPNVSNNGNGAIFASSSVYAEIDKDNNTTATSIFGVRADGASIPVFSVREDGLITATSAITGLTNITASGNATIGTNDTNTHIFRGAFSMAYGAGSTTRMSMTNTGLLMLGASTTPVAGVQLESGNTGSGTPSDYVLVKSSGSVASRGGLLISNQASVSGTTNSLKITGTFNSSTSGVVNVGWVDNNATETWVGGTSSMVFSYNSAVPFTRFNQTLQMLAGQIITSSTANNFINIDNSGNFQLASRSSVNVYIDYDNNTTATALYNIIADNSTTLFSLREDGVFTINYTNAVTNVFTITGTTLTTGSSLRVYDNSSDANVRRVIFATNDHVSATGCIVAHLQQDSTANALYIDHNDNGISINIDAENTTARAVDVVCDVLTTGSIGRFYSNSADTSTRSLTSIINDNTSATGVTMMSFQQDAVTSTNFKRYIALDGIIIWTSHTGTDPNGALSGNAGDMCLSTNGNIYRCTSGTTWVAM